MRLKPVFISMGVWGFGATMFALGASRWWLAVAAAALMWLAFLGAVVAEFAEEYTRRGSVVGGARLDEIVTMIDDVQTEVEAVRDDMAEIVAALKVIQAANAYMRVSPDLHGTVPLRAPFAPLPDGKRT